MKEALGKIRDITIIAGIYIYFIGWIYVHQYLHQFGLSSTALKIDYYSLLVYSYNVITSTLFFRYFLIIAGILLFTLGILRLIAISKDRSAFNGRLYHAIRKVELARSYHQLRSKYSLLLTIIVLALLFPLLYHIADRIAQEDYKEDRWAQSRNLKTIEFVFRGDVDVLSPPASGASSLTDTGSDNKVATIKYSARSLRLLGESDQYYIVLAQPPLPPGMQSLPEGNVVFIDKKDVLLARIILPQLNN